jgi:single-strand DNA-binding protein
MDLNKVMIIGRLTRDPELRAIPSGINVCQMSVATSYVYTNKQTGQKVEQSEFHNVVLWTKLGEIAAQYLKKGARVYIEGRLQTRSWDDKTSGQKRYRTEIVGDNMIMLDSKSSSSSSSSSAFSPVAQPAKSSNDFANQSSPTEELPTIQQEEDINVEDIPF